MRMHFRPSLGSDARAGAVLGAIFDAALESRYRQHRRPSRSGFLVLGSRVERTSYPVRSPGSARSELRRQRTIILSLERDQVEVLILVWARENRNRPLRPHVPGRSERARMARQVRPN